MFVVDDGDGDVEIALLKTNVVFVTAVVGDDPLLPNIVFVVLDLVVPNKSVVGTFSGAKVGF